MSDDSPKSRIAIEDALVRYVIPATVALLFVAMMAFEGRKPASDLVLTAPESVARGATLPVRAQMNRGLDRPEGPSPVDAPIDVELLAGSRRIVRLRLTRSAVVGSEGTIAIPDDAPRTLTLVARTDHAHGDLFVARSVAISSTPTRPASVPRRGVEAFPVHEGVEALGEPPNELELRVEGGLCVPEVPCRVLVWVGAPAAAIALEASGPVEIAPSASDGERETSGIVERDVVVHGPSPGVVLVASRGGAVVARREVTLPITMGGLAARVTPRRLALGERPTARVATLGGSAATLVDVFHEGAFAAASSLGSTEARALVLAPRFEPGLSRVQLRRDAYSLDGSAEAFVFVGDDVRSLARSIDARRPDAFAHAFARGAAIADTPDDRVVRFLVAPDEADVVALPEGTSSAERILDEQRARAAQARTVIAAIIAMLGLLSASIVLKRGLTAGADEVVLLREAEIEFDEGVARRRAMRTAVLAALLVLFGFGIAAALILVRGIV